MKNITSLVVTFGLLLSSASVFAATYAYEGVNKKGDACSILIETDLEGELTSLTMSGQMVVNYHIPAPFSGLYGEYYMEKMQTLQREAVEEKYYTTQPLNVEHDQFSDKVILTTQKTATPGSANKDINVTLYEVILDNDFENLNSYKYQERVRLKKILPFVSTDMTCLDLKTL